EVDQRHPDKPHEDRVGHDEHHAIRPYHSRGCRGQGGRPGELVVTDALRECPWLERGARPSIRRRPKARSHAPAPDRAPPSGGSGVTRWNTPPVTSSSAPVRMATRPKHTAPTAIMAA